MEKLRAWSDCDEDVERSFSKDELLTNIMMYWVTATMHASIRNSYRDRNMQEPQPGAAHRGPSGIRPLPQRYTRDNPSTHMSGAPPADRALDADATGLTLRRAAGSRAAGRGLAGLLPSFPSVKSSLPDVPILSPGQMGTKIGTLSQDRGTLLLVDSLQVPFFQMRRATRPLAARPSVWASGRPPSVWRNRVFAP